MARNSEPLMRDEGLTPGPALVPRREAQQPAHDQVHVYRPGGALAATLMLSPALLSLLAAGLSLAIVHTVLAFVPALLALLLPAVAASWAMCVSVRTSAASIGTVRMLRTWHEIPWSLVDTAQRHGPRVVLTSSSGQRIAFTPWLLSDGARLYRDLLVRLPAHVLDANMSAGARHLLGERVLLSPQGGLTGSLTTRPRPVWRIATLTAAIVLLIIGAASLVWAHPPISLALGLAALAGTMVTLALFCWSSQHLVVSNDGIQVAFMFTRNPRHLAWSEVALIEHTPGERVLRLRGDQRLICAGPALLRPTERDMLRAFLHIYCISRGVPVVQRRWII